MNIQSNSPIFQPVIADRPPVVSSPPVRGNAKSPRDSAQLSDTSKVMNKIMSFLNVNNPHRFSFEGFSQEEKKEFVQILSRLIRNGIIGCEIIEVNGQDETRFLDTEIGDKRLYGAKQKNLPLY